MTSLRRWPARGPPRLTCAADLPRLACAAGLRAARPGWFAPAGLRGWPGGWAAPAGCKRRLNI